MEKIQLTLTVEEANILLEGWAKCPIKSISARKQHTATGGTADEQRQQTQREWRKRRSHSGRGYLKS